MSELVFTPCTGGVEIVRQHCPPDNFLTITIDGKEFSGTYITTGITLELSGNYQFLHTVNDFVYFYAFGDRVGLLTVNGIGFINTCDGTTGKTHIFDLYDYYMSNRTSVRRGRALDITLSSQSRAISLHGFLTGIKLDVNQSDMGPIGYWTLRFEVLPRKMPFGGENSADGNYWMYGATLA